MKLLVTTSQSLLLVDSDSGSHTVLDRGRGLYYGIAEADGKLFVASRLRAASDSERDTERGQILVFDQRLQPLGLLNAPFPLRDLHEIAWHQGKLYASCSHDNMVAIYDGANWEQWFPLGGTPLGGRFEDVKGPGDINHFNSFFFEEGRIWVLAHNRGPSELLGFSLDTRTLVERIKLGEMAHNIWREDGQLFTCSSIDGKVVSEHGFVLETGGFPRGVAFAPGLRCVGVSAMAERKARDFTTGKLALYDDVWKLQKEIVLQDEGLVLDVRVLPPGFEHVPKEVDKAEVALPDHSPETFYRAYEDRNRGSRELIKSRLMAYRPFFEPWVTREPAPRALDLGCGRGEWLEVLRDAGYAASGVDLDDGMLAGLRKRGIDVHHKDALQALRETPEASIAIVSAFHLVEHIPFEDVRTLIREAMRVLKPGGLLILETPNPENIVVGASLFYQDPTHLRPLPPELLRFAVEFEGFGRHIVARLQEDPALAKAREIGLWNVIEGASPDYAVVGQKAGDERFLHAFNNAFGARYGLLSPTLASRYVAQERRRSEDVAAHRDTDLELRLDLRFDTRINQQSQEFHDALQQYMERAESRIVELEKRVDFQAGLFAQIFESPAWKMTAPLRWFAIQIRLIRKMGVRTRLSMAKAKLAGFAVRKTVGVIDKHPGLRKVLVRLIKSTGLYRQFKPMYQNSVGQSAAAAAAINTIPTQADMSVRANRIYQDLQAASENTSARSREAS